MIKKILLTLFLSVIFCAQTIAKDDIKYDYDQENKFHIYKIDLDTYGKKLKPFVSKEGLKTTGDVFKENDFLFALNGGFFDFNNKNSVSYIVENGVVTNTPFEDTNLILALGKQNRLEGVLNRAEFRIIEEEKSGKLSFDINNHFVPVQKGYKIKYSLQGGPLMGEDLNLENEGFLVYDENGLPKEQYADVLKKRPRTIIALKDDYLYVILYTTFAPATISEANHQLKKYKFDKIMALDGGGSTSLNYKDKEISSANGKQREVKSFLVIEK